MSVEIAWKQNILVTDFHLLKSLLVVLGFGSQAFICGFSRQNICSVVTTSMDKLCHSFVISKLHKIFVSILKLMEEFTAFEKNSVEKTLNLNNSWSKMQKSQTWNVWWKNFSQIVASTLQIYSITLWLSYSHTLCLNSQVRSLVVLCIYVPQI